jgi:dihydrofolate reductase
METDDEFAEGAHLDPDYIASFLAGIDCYVMGSATYETALGFEEQNLGWAYGDKPVYVLTTRSLRRTRDTVEFLAGDLGELIERNLRTRHRNIWVAGGGSVVRESLRRGLVDEIRYSILPVLIGEGIPFFGSLLRDTPLHLAEAKAYRNGIVALRYQVTGRTADIASGSP